MKLLLDENMPKPNHLKKYFPPGHEIYSVKDMGWRGKMNGELLGLMLFHDFDGLITVDKNIRHQQNLRKWPLRFFVINALGNQFEEILPFLSNLLDALNNSSPDEQVILIEKD